MVSCHRARTGDRASGGRVWWRHRRVHIRFPFSRRVQQRRGRLGPADSQQTWRNRVRLGPADSQQTRRNRVRLGPTPRSVGTACAHPPVTAPAQESPPGRERGQRKGGTGNPGSTPSPDPPRSGSRADFPPLSFLVLHVCFPRSRRAARAFAPFAQTWVQAARLAPGRGGAGPSLRARGPRSRKPSASGGLRLPTRGGDRHAPTDEERGNELSQSPLASRRGQR